MTDLNQLPLKQAALEYAARGFHVIPCRTKDKRPLVEWKDFQVNAPDLEMVDAWWSLWPDANIAVILGNGRIAVDVDGAEGHDALKAAGIEFPPDTPTSLTGRGVHYLLRGQADDRIGLLPKVDIRGKGIIVVPPSVHESGKVYTWLVPPTSLLEAPRSLQRLLETPSAALQTPLSGHDWVTEAMQGVGEGVRNVTCTRLAGYFLAKGVPPDAVKALLTGWAAKCRPPLPFSEVMASVDSIAQREGAHHDEPKSLFDDLMSVKQLYEKTPNEHQWVVRDYMPKGGLVLLSSAEKAGKSTLSYALIASVSKGLDFLGKKSEKGSVLVLAVEEHAVDVKMRAMKFGIEEADPVSFFVGDFPPTQESYTELRDMILAHKFSLVILDTLGHHLAGIIDNENDNMVMLKALKPWLRLARETNAAVLVIHHKGKGEQAYRGASSLGGIVDQILTLRYGGDYRRVLEARGRYWNTPKSIWIELRDNQYVVLP